MIAVAEPVVITSELGARLLQKPALVLSGAGLSTDSGIPDYRSPESLAKKHTPMTFQRFRADEAARRHYWARSHVGWTNMRSVRPNSGHQAVADLQNLGAVTGVVTQNVDGLHQRAGSTEVLELHGTLSQVRCLSCRRAEPMDSFQQRQAELNPGFDERAARVNPDGDVELDPSQTTEFRPAACLHCDGVLKTDVVFFGENVPAAVVSRAWQLLEEADSLLVLGSSLTVFSGYRFVDGARKAGKPVFIVNDGPTRADEIADLKLEGRLGTILPQVVSQVERLHGRSAAR